MRNYLPSILINVIFLVLTKNIDIKYDSLISFVIFI